MEAIGEIPTIAVRVKAKADDAKRFRKKALLTN
jgi:hypothetical protein